MRFIKCPRDEEMQDAEMPEAEDVADAVQAALDWILELMALSFSLQRSATVEGDQ